jgi:DNA polymerase/3'-5' exonuclease PolX
MDLARAEEIASDLVRKIRPFCRQIEVCGSIRRRKSEVNDIDIVVIPSDLYGLISWLSYNTTVLKSGAKIIEGKYRRFQYDIYIASEETFETIKLIRTGSASFNVKLASIALAKGWKLKADGTGLIDSEGNVIARSEIEILQKLLGKWVPPEERE